ncbi:MAG: SpoVA/SpoVAEb family sporulation membrane protein [Lachnospiraceae bacterium]
MLWLTFLKAFAVGGAICLIGQIIINWTHLTNGKILVIFLLAGAVLQGFGVYEYLIKWAGAGASVPISGFGYALVKGAVEAQNRRRGGRFYRRTCRLRNRSVRCDFLRLSRRADFQTAYKNLLIWAGQAQNLLLRNKIV